MLHRPCEGNPECSAFLSECIRTKGHHEQTHPGGRGSGGQSADSAGSVDERGIRDIEVENGEEALPVAARERPDLILMDIQLPLLDGYEATRRIKADPALRAIPIIAITSYALGGDESKARAAGCDAYVAKPYSPRALLAKIREYVP